MQPPAKRAPAPTALLTIRGEGHSWGIPSSAVASVERPEAVAEAPLELLSLLGITVPQARANSRVLVLEVQGQRLSLLVHGSLALARSEVNELLPLPAAVQAQSPLISHLAVIDGKPALFVVSPERLLQAARSVPAPASSPDDAHASARGSSCSRP